LLESTLIKNYLSTTSNRKSLPSSVEGTCILVQLSLLKNMASKPQNVPARAYMTDAKHPDERWWSIAFSSACMKLNAVVTLTLLWVKVGCGQGCLFVDWNDVRWPS
jgi:hypothetical protein